MLQIALSRFQFLMLFDTLAVKADVVGTPTDPFDPASTLRLTIMAGTPVMFNTNIVAPPTEGFAPIDGSSYDKAEYPSLYAIFGDAWGSTETTFSTPAQSIVSEPQLLWYMALEDIEVTSIPAT